MINKYKEIGSGESYVLGYIDLEDLLLRFFRGDRS